MSAERKSGHSQLVPRQFAESKGAAIHEIFLTHSSCSSSYGGRVVWDIISPFHTHQFQHTFTAPLCQVGRSIFPKWSPEKQQLRAALCSSPDVPVPPLPAPCVLGHLLPPGRVAAGTNTRAVNDPKDVQAICQPESSAFLSCLFFFNLSEIQSKDILVKRLIQKNSTLIMEGRFLAISCCPALISIFNAGRRSSLELLALLLLVYHC